MKIAKMYAQELKDKDCNLVWTVYIDKYETPV